MIDENEEIILLMKSIRFKEDDVRNTAELQVVKEINLSDDYVISMKLWKTWIIVSGEGLKTL